MSNPSLSRPVRHAGGLLTAVVLALAMAGCGSVDRTVPTAAIPADYHARHPVVLTDATEPLDIFLVGPTGRLDRRQEHDLEAFAAHYLAHGESGIVIGVPTGAVDHAAAERTLTAVRRALVALGVRQPIRVGTYPVADPALTSPLHLSYTRLQARIASRCGDWPDDLNSGASLHGWDNRSYYNLGCAATKTLAAQVDDPRDLVRGRAEDPSDVQLRTRAIGFLRRGVDPGTIWSVGNTSISQVGAN